MYDNQPAHNYQSQPQIARLQNNNFVQNNKPQIKPAHAEMPKQIQNKQLNKSNINDNYS